MKLSEMSPEQRREYNRNAKRQQRAKEEAKRMRSMIPLARDYVTPELQQKKSDQYTDQIAKTIQADLGVEELAEQDAYIVDAVARVTHGLENNFGQIVSAPDGVIVCGWFPDAAASETILHVHKFPDLLKSVTFTELYKSFLHAVLKWSKKNEYYVDIHCLQELKQEIAGTYTLPAPPKPEPEPPKAVDEPLPSIAEILGRGRIELLTRLQPEDPNISPDAQRYLDHGPTRR